MVGEYCEPQVTFEWVLGLPSKPKPFTIYFVKTNNVVEMWVANKDGQLTLINTSVTVSEHNSLSGLQGGEPGQYYHLTQAEYQNLGVGQNLQQTLEIGSQGILTNNATNATVNPLIAVYNSAFTRGSAVNIYRDNAQLQSVSPAGSSAVFVGGNVISNEINDLARLKFTDTETTFYLNVAKYFDESTLRPFMVGAAIPSVTKVQEMINSSPTTGVQSVTGYIVNNTDPANPIIKLPSEGNDFYRTEKGYQWISGVRTPNTNQLVDEIGDWFTGQKDGKKYPVLRWNGGNKNLLTSYEGIDYFFFLPFSTEPDYE